MMLFPVCLAGLMGIKVIWSGHWLISDEEREEVAQTLKHRSICVCHFGRQSSQHCAYHWHWHSMAKDSTCDVFGARTYL